MAAVPKLERVLVVDEDVDVLDLLERQVLEPLGYEVASANDAASAIQQALTFAPDLIIASLTLPGLSGKDLLVALRSQGIDLPTLVMAHEGMEADAIQAFRLGASDYLVKPLREAEVVTAVERAIHETRLRQERGRLAQQLADSNRQLERRVRELTTLFGIGKTVTSTTNQSQLFNKLMEGSLYVTEADMGWILLEEEASEQLLLRSHSNMPPAIASKLHQPWEDGVSALVMLSGEALAIDGEGLSQFKIAKLVQAVLIAPIKVRDKPIGVIAVARQKGRPFSDRDQAMLEAVADYASISLVNVRLFQALEARAFKLQQVVGEADIDAQARAEWRSELDRGLRAARAQIITLIEGTEDEDTLEGLKIVDEVLAAIIKQVASATDMDTGELVSLKE
ncbi:MAG: response regulator [Anaerolineales bacterium]|nr:response regulator [Anaerolineales bacterium]